MAKGLPSARTSWGVGDLNDVRDEVAARPVVLTWDSAANAYAPAYLASSTVPKEFRGPTDPNTVTGVVLNTYDVWMST